MDTKEEKQRKETLKQTRDFIVFTTHPNELAGIIGSMLKALDTETLKSQISAARDKSDLTERGNYSLGAMLEVIRIADKYKKDYSQNSSDKFPGMAISTLEE